MEEVKQIEVDERKLKGGRGKPPIQRQKVYEMGLVVLVCRMCGFSERWIAERFSLNRAELGRFCKRFDLPNPTRVVPIGGFAEALRKLQTLEIWVEGKCYKMGWSLVEPIVGRAVDFRELDQVDDLTRLAQIKHRQAMKMRGLSVEEKAKEWAKTMDGLDDEVG